MNLLRQSHYLLHCSPPPNPQNRIIQTMTTQHHHTIARIESPSVDVLCLVGALSNPENHQLHLQAIQARDAAMAQPQSYNQFALELSRLLVHSAHPQAFPTATLQEWHRRDPNTVQKLQSQPTLWTIFGQTAGLLLKNVLVRPPLYQQQHLSLDQSSAQAIQDALLVTLSFSNKHLSNVASTVIAATAVSTRHVQPFLHLTQWPSLSEYLLSSNINNNNNKWLVWEKIMEDAPTEVGPNLLDRAIPQWLQVLLSVPQQHPTLNTNETTNNTKRSALHCLNYALPLQPASLVTHWDEYMRALSVCASSSSETQKQTLSLPVCQNLVSILRVRPQALASHIESVVVFLLQATSCNDTNSKNDATTVALEACDFWLVFATMENNDMPTVIHETIQGILPQLLVILCNNMVYTPEQQADLLSYDESNVRPVFHKSRNHHHNNTENGYESDNEGDDDDDENEWNLRKCSAASLDSLAHLFGGNVILPILLPILQVGLSHTDPWKQEASILALGAVAEGCQEEMKVHLNTVHPYLLRILMAENALPAPVKTIASWTVGQYAFWVVDQVQSGANGALLAQMTEIFLNCIFDVNPKVQHSCCSAFGVLVEASGDLMSPYLEPIYQTLTRGIFEFSGRTLLCLLDVLGIIADSCGPAIAEGTLPSLYIPPLLKLWDDRAKRDPRDQILLPLMESLASIAITSGMNFQPYALETFDYSMANIEAVTLLLASECDEPIRNEEEVDHIICATDLLDALVEGLGGNIVHLVRSSQRYGPQFLNVLLSLSQHDVPGVRTSAFALLGDLARHAPTMLQPALPQLLQQSVANMDPIHPATATNAVWATGEICVRCDGNSEIVRPFAPTILQNLVALLMGNGTFVDMEGFSGQGSTLPGLAENAASCLGRLALLDATFVSPQLPTFLLGWCDGLAKISDLSERRDGFSGFVKAVYGNPQAIQTAAANPVDAIVSILFAIVSWHISEMLPDDGAASLLGSAEYQFRPFPASEAQLGQSLKQLIQDLKQSVEPQTWHLVSKGVPVNVRKLLREVYEL